jgi:hypothetical protein
MAAKTTRTIGSKLPAPPAPKLTMIPAGAEERGTSLLAPLQPDVDGLQVVDAESYEEADQILNKVQTARKKWNAEMYGADGKSGPIPSIRTGLDALYALNRKIDKPLELLEASIKSKMQAFKLEEARQLRAAQDAREAETRRLAALEQEALRKAAEAPTPQLAGRFVKQAEHAAIALEVAQEQPAPQPVQAFNSATRTVKKWRLANPLAFAKAVADGTYDTGYVGVSEDAVRLFNEMLRTDPEGLGAYPGIEVYEDIRIVGR